MQNKNKLVWFIKDSLGFVLGIYESKIKAKAEIAWFLPKDEKYKIEPNYVSDTEIN